MRISFAVAAALALGACDAPEPDQSSDAAEDGQATETVAPPSDWIELDLAEGAFHTPSGEYRSDIIEIEVPADTRGLEYKLAMREGDAITYTWRAADIESDSLLLSEFHGHTERVGDEPGTVMFYRKATGGAENGALVAPFDGIHGWYFLNSGSAPVTVELQVSGFYELVADR